MKASRTADLTVAAPTRQTQGLHAYLQASILGQPGRFMSSIAATQSCPGIWTVEDGSMSVTVAAVFNATLLGPPSSSVT